MPVEAAGRARLQGESALQGCHWGGCGALLLLPASARGLATAKSCPATQGRPRLPGAARPGPHYCAHLGAPDAEDQGYLARDRAGPRQQVPGVVDGHPLQQRGRRLEALWQVLRGGGGWGTKRTGGRVG
jgi:hypothetical protein